MSDDTQQKKAQSNPLLMAMKKSSSQGEEQSQLTNEKPHESSESIQEREASEQKSAKELPTVQQRNQEKQESEAKKQSGKALNNQGKQEPSNTANPFLASNNQSNSLPKKSLWDSPTVNKHDIFQPSANKDQPKTVQRQKQTEQKANNPFANIFNAQAKNSQTSNLFSGQPPSIPSFKSVKQEQKRPSPLKTQNSNETFSLNQENKKNIFGQTISDKPTNIFSSLSEGNKSIFPPKNLSDTLKQPNLFSSKTEETKQKDTLQINSQEKKKLEGNTVLTKETENELKEQNNEEEAAKAVQPENQQIIMEESSRQQEEESQEDTNQKVPEEIFTKLKKDIYSSKDKGKDVSNALQSQGKNKEQQILQELNDARMSAFSEIWKSQNASESESEKNTTKLLNLKQSEENLQLSKLNKKLKGLKSKNEQLTEIKAGVQKIISAHSQKREAYKPNGWIEGLPIQRKFQKALKQFDEKCQQQSQQINESNFKELLDEVSNCSQFGKIVSLSEKAQISQLIKDTENMNKEIETLDCENQNLVNKNQQLLRSVYYLQSEINFKKQQIPFSEKNKTKKQVSSSSSYKQSRKDSYLRPPSELKFKKSTTHRKITEKKRQLQNLFQKLQESEGEVYKLQKNYQQTVLYNRQLRSFSEMNEEERGYHLSEALDRNDLSSKYSPHDIRQYFQMLKSGLKKGSVSQVVKKSQANSRAQNAAESMVFVENLI